MLSNTTTALHLIRERGTMRISELAKELGCGYSSAYAALWRLKRHGLVTAVKDPAHAGKPGWVPVIFQRTQVDANE